MFTFSFFLVFLTKLLPHLLDSVCPDVVVFLACDRGQLLLLPPLLLLYGYGTIEITPVLDNDTITLQLPDLVEQGVPAPGQHEVEV